MVASLPSPGDPDPDPATARPPASQAPVLPPPAAGVTYRDFIFETSVIEAPTATKTQSKLWFAHGAWWAGLFQPFTNQVNIFRLDWDTQLWIDTGTLVDERSFADPDFLWTGDHLYVVTAGPRDTARHAARVLRFSYDEEDRRFELDSNFPVTITDTGMSASVVARDGTGKLWVTYVADGRVWIVASREHDATWGAPFPLPVDGTAVDPEDVASVTAFGPGLVGVMWSNQLEHRVLFSVHRDGDPDDTWSQPEVVIEGQDHADDHINLKSFRDDGRDVAIAAIKTSLDTREPVNPQSPLILLAVRDAGAGWTTHLVSRVEDRQTRAIVMVDEDARMVYVAATTPSRGGEIHYKRAPLDAISFDTGQGEPLIASELDVRVSNASSAKHALTAESGLLVAGSDNGTGRYLHGILDLGGGLPPADPADPSRPERPDAPDPPSAITFVRNNFEPWDPGPARGTGWHVRDEDPPDALAIANDGAGGRALRIRSARQGGAPVRACHSFPDREGTTLTVDLRVRVTGGGSSDHSILSLRGSGGEAAVVRATDRGGFGWFVGTTKVHADASFSPGQVYRVVATLDQATRTFSFRVFAADGTRIVRQDGLPWRLPAVTSVREICLETATGIAQRIELLEVEVLEQPPG